jgi:hypothetical protein
MRATSVATGFYVEGLVTGYTGTTLAMTSDTFTGTGAHTDWNINLAGNVGSTGPTGPTGTGGVLDYADFYALMPGDNAATVGVGTAVAFPQNGPTSAGGITRTADTTFQLAAIGTYMVTWQVSVDEAGQLDLKLDAAELPATVVGRATGTNQIVGVALVTTASTNSILSVCNPTGNSTALTITPNAGGAGAVSAHLVIVRIR